MKMDEGKEISKTEREKTRDQAEKTKRTGEAESDGTEAGRREARMTTRRKRTSLRCQF